MSTVDDIEAVARAAVLAGGEVLRARYHSGGDEATYTAYDVKAAADEAAEERMLPLIRRAFPDHTVFSEEAGEFDGTGSYRWIVDPLDGTNNFTAGLPTFASAVSVTDGDTPLLAAVHQPVTDETYVVRRGAGVRCDGAQVTTESSVSVDAATVAFIIGRDVPREMELSRQASAIQQTLGETVKRVCPSWAPTVHSGLFARGRVQGLVEFHPDEEERVVTQLLASEAGAITERDGPVFVAASTREVFTALWEAVTDAHS